jgi:hypothetical protein
VGTANKKQAKTVHFGLLLIGRFRTSAPIFSASPKSPGKQTAWK